MKRKNRNLPARFAAETRFELDPVVPVPRRGTEETALERLKSHLLEQTLQDPDAAGLQRRLRQAANEAAAVAWFTPFPLLVFPALFEEKADRARGQAERQQAILRKGRAKSRPLAA